MGHPVGVAHHANSSLPFQDGDGKLSKSEFLSFSHPEEDQGMYDAVVRSLLRNKDKNGDGVIDFQVGCSNLALPVSILIPNDS